jgi:hypothetical protein
MAYGLWKTQGGVYGDVELEALTKMGVRQRTDLILKQMEYE